MALYVLGKNTATGAWETGKLGSSLEDVGKWPPGFSILLKAQVSSIHRPLQATSAVTITGDLLSSELLPALSLFLWSPMMCLSGSPDPLTHHTGLEHGRES